MSSVLIETGAGFLRQRDSAGASVEGGAPSGVLVGVSPLGAESVVDGDDAAALPKGVPSLHVLVVDDDHGDVDESRLSFL